MATELLVGEVAFDQPDDLAERVFEVESSASSTVDAREKQGHDGVVDHRGVARHGPILAGRVLGQKTRQGRAPASGGTPPRNVGPRRSPVRAFPVKPEWW